MGLLASIYYPFVKDWLDVFPREQVLLIKAEDFYSNPVAVMDRVYHFLGVGKEACFPAKLKERN